MTSKLTANQVIGKKAERVRSKVQSPIRLPIQEPDWDKILIEIEHTDLISVLLNKIIAHDEKCGLSQKADHDWETYRENVVWFFIRQHLEDMWKAPQPLTPKQ